MKEMTETTESRNPRTLGIDKASTEEMLGMIQEENLRAAEAVGEALPAIARAVDSIAEGMAAGGRLIYVGAGSSGRLGILDAVECPPTYGVSPSLVSGILAGGEACMFRASESEEDSADAGARDILEKNLVPADRVVGISAAGGAMYVISALRAAKAAGCVTIGLTSNAGSLLDKEADIAIVVKTGAEAITGSTRMKAGTAQKMVLNMLSTGAMIKLGKVYGNLMVDVKPSNEKLIRRCVTIVCSAAECTEAEATKALEECDYRPKVAIVMVLRGVNADTACAMLQKAEGRIAKVLEA